MLRCSTRPLQAKACSPRGGAQVGAIPEGRLRLLVRRDWSFVSAAFVAVASSPESPLPSGLVTWSRPHVEYAVRRFRCTPHLTGLRGPKHRKLGEWRSSGPSTVHVRPCSDMSWLFPINSDSENCPRTMRYDIFCKGLHILHWWPRQDFFKKTYFFQFWKASKVTKPVDFYEGSDPEFCGFRTQHPKSIWPVGANWTTSDVRNWTGKNFWTELNAFLTCLNWTWHHKGSNMLKLPSAAPTLSCHTVPARVL